MLGLIRGTWRGEADGEGGAAGEKWERIRKTKGRKRKRKGKGKLGKRRKTKINKIKKKENFEPLI